MKMEELTNEANDMGREEKGRKEIVNRRKKGEMEKKWNKMVLEEENQENQKRDMANKIRNNNDAKRQRNRRRRDDALDKKTKKVR